jgi:hypothetical protein
VANRLDQAHIFGARLLGRSVLSSPAVSAPYPQTSQAEPVNPMAGDRSSWANVEQLAASWLTISPGPSFLAGPGRDDLEPLASSWWVTVTLCSCDTATL